MMKEFHLTSLDALAKHILKQSEKGAREAIKALYEKPKKVAGLHALGVDDILGLLTYYPRRHVDPSLAAGLAIATGAKPARTASLKKSSSVNV